MSRRPRVECESNFYHVTTRGAGRMDIFEDDDDRREFLRLLAQCLQKNEVELHAWCLMSNHIHLLVHAPIAAVSTAMHRLLGIYAAFFNGRHGHVGHLFQDRFASKPVVDDAQLMLAVRYIHLNPLEAGVDDYARYEWSSYSEYMGTGRRCLAQTDFVLGVFGSISNFECFHRTANNGTAGSRAIRSNRLTLSDDMARVSAEKTLDCADLHALKTLAKPERDEALATMKALGLSVRQIERLTGIGRGIVQRAKMK